jgi:hypothetical protein
MALFFECMLQCAQKVLDAADIVRDGDLSTIDGIVPDYRQLGDGLAVRVSRCQTRLEPQKLDL